MRFSKYLISSAFLGACLLVGFAGALIFGGGRDTGDFSPVLGLNRIEVPEIGEEVFEGETNALACIENLRLANQEVDTFLSHSKAMKAVDALEPSDYASLHSLMRSESGGDWPLYRSILFLKWIEANEDGFLSFVATLTPEERRGEEIAMAMRYASLANKDSGELVSLALEELDVAAKEADILEAKGALEMLIEQGDLRSVEFGTLKDAFSRLANLDPTSAIRILGELGDPMIVGRVLSKMKFPQGVDVSALDDLKVLKENGALGNALIYDVGLSRILASISAERQWEAMQWGRANMTDFEFLEFLEYSTALHHGSATNKEQLELVMALPYSAKRDSIMQRLLRAFPSSEDAYRLAGENLPDYMAASLGARYVGELYQQGELPRALQEMERLSGTPGYNSVLSSLRDSWGEDSPSEYAEWAIQNVDAKGLNEALRGVEVSWLEQDRFGLFDFVGLLPSGRLKSGLEIRIGRELDPEESLLFAVDQIEDPVSRAEIVADASVRLSYSDPEAALRFLAEIDFTQEIERKKAVMGNVINNWAQRDINAATAYVDQLHDLDLKEYSQLTLAPDYFAFNQEAALNWIESLPPNASRDRVLSNIAYGLNRLPTHSSDGRLEYRERLINLISDEGVRGHLKQDSITIGESNEH